MTSFKPCLAAVGVDHLDIGKGADVPERWCYSSSGPRLQRFGLEDPAGECDQLARKDNFLTRVNGDIVSCWFWSLA